MLKLITPFTKACEKGDTLNAILLLRQMEDLNISLIPGMTPLRIAVQARNQIIVDHILQYGVDTEIPAADGRTPFLISATLGLVDIMQILQKAGANIHAIDNNNRNALHLASSHPSALDFLLLNGVDTTYRNDEGYTPLIMAAVGDKIESIKVLLNHGVDINQTNKWGVNAFYLSCGMYTDTATLEFLVSHGANIHSVDDNNINALHRAVFRGDHKHVKFLLDLGLDPQTPTSFQESAFNIARSYDDHEMIEIFKNWSKNKKKESTA